MFPKIRRWRARIYSDTSILTPVLEHDSKISLSESLSLLSMIPKYLSPILSLSPHFPPVPTLRPLKRAHALLKVLLTRARKKLIIHFIRPSGDPFSDNNLFNSMS